MRALAKRLTCNCFLSTTSLISESRKNTIKSRNKAVFVVLQRRRFLFTLPRRHPPPHTTSQSSTQQPRLLR
ncbi:hypothetical protein VTO58DRAFT_103819 [Aureobasidium pullulans]